MKKAKLKALLRERELEEQKKNIAEDKKKDEKKKGKSKWEKSE